MIKTALKSPLQITMKILCLIAITLLAATGCSKPKTMPINNPLQGKWKLIEVSIVTEYQLYEIIDYSEKNIIYDFQEGQLLRKNDIFHFQGKLIITGNVDYSYIFYDFQEGEHYYDYWEQIYSPSGIPHKNLIIDNQELDKDRFEHERGGYVCFIDYYDKPMIINGNKIIVRSVDEVGEMVDYDYYAWTKTFVKQK